MSDEETVCSFMEIKPTEWAERREVSSEGWWQWKWSVVNQAYRAWPSDKTDSLDALREVESRLTENQWHSYLDAFPDEWIGYTKPWIHASAQDKLRALAAVIRAQKENA